MRQFLGVHFCMLWIHLATRRHNFFSCTTTTQQKLATQLYAKKSRQKYREISRFINVYQVLSISINVCNQLFRTRKKTVKIFLPLFYFVMQVLYTTQSRKSLSQFLVLATRGLHFRYILSTYLLHPGKPTEPRTYDSLFSEPQNALLNPTTQASNKNTAHSGGCFCL